jgi:hypothetical protein
MVAVAPEAAIDRTPIPATTGGTVLATDSTCCVCPADAPAPADRSRFETTVAPESGSIEPALLPAAAADRPVLRDRVTWPSHGGYSSTPLLLQTSRLLF